jgi:hypothetical protein
MYHCYDHNWASREQMCPSCLNTTYTSTSGTSSVSNRCDLCWTIYGTNTVHDCKYKITSPMSKREDVKTETYPICVKCSGIIEDAPKCEKVKRRLMAWLIKNTGHYELRYYPDTTTLLECESYERAVWLDPPEELFE